MGIIKQVYYPMSINFTQRESVLFIQQPIFNLLVFISVQIWKIKALQKGTILFMCTHTK